MKDFFSNGVYFVIRTRKTGRNFLPNVCDALPDVINQFLNLGPKLGHPEDVEEGRDSTGEEIVDVAVDMLRNLDREL